MRGEVRAGRREGVGWWWRERHARGKGPTQGLGGRARAERTLNMPYMTVTLEVSKLSGWFSFCAPCQPKGGACDMGRGADGEAVGSGAAQAGMQTGKVRPQGLGVRARAGRTSNMFCMFVTLEVSQLSGWLKACASCRVEREGHAMRGEVQAGRREGVGRWRRKRRARGRPESRLGGQGTRGAHPEHVAHGRDVGGVPAGNVRVEVRQCIEEVAHVGDP